MANLDQPISNSKVLSTEVKALNKNMLMANFNSSKEALAKLQNQIDQIKILVEMEETLSTMALRDQYFNETEEEESQKESEGRGCGRASTEEIQNMLTDKYENGYMYRALADKYGRPIDTVITIIKRHRSEEQLALDLSIETYVPMECIKKHPKNERMARLVQLYYLKTEEGRPAYKKSEIENILREEGHVIKDGTFQQVYNYVDPNRRCCSDMFEDGSTYYDETQVIIDEVGELLIEHRVEPYKIDEIIKVLSY